MKSRFLDVETLEPRRLMAVQHPVAINFNDESLWDANFSTAVAQAKSLGVTAVRLWLGFESYDSRPNAWDYVPPFSQRDTGDGVQRQNPAPGIIKKAFELDREGFSVTLVVQPQFGIVPSSDSQLRGIIRHFMEATETPSSGTPLKDAVDYWEIGNEVDAGLFWAPSASDKTSGLQSYVDKFLIPAADELHLGSDNELVITSGTAGNPADVGTIVNRLSAKGRADAADYVGFHPYGNYDPANPSVNEPKTRTATAKAYANSIGKSMIATEWNVRGYGTDGSRNATWAQAIDAIYKQVILPNYEIGFYFALTNNWAGRGGTTTARPASVLKHNTNLSVSPSSSFATLEQYYNTSIVPNEPFYSMMKAWGGNNTTAQYGKVAGTVYNYGTGILPSSRIYIDRNNNGLFDTGEPSTVTDSAGRYSIQYSSTELTAGTYSLGIVLPTNWQLSLWPSNLQLTAQGNITGADFYVYGNTVTPPPPTTGTISGVVFGDSNNNGLYDTGDSLGPARVVFIDTNTNGKLDSGEKQVTSDANGVFTFANLSAGTYNITRVYPAGYRMSNNTLGYIAITVAGGQTISNAHVGSTNQAASGGGSTGGGGNTPSGIGSIAGLLFNDSNSDGNYQSSEQVAAARVVYIDTNNNNKLDSGEKQVTTDSAGKYKFSNLAAGTYRVRRVMPTGYKLTTPSAGFHLITLNPGQVVTAKDFGSKAS